MLGLPIAYIIADMTYLTVSQTLVDALTIGILLTFPYALYLIARLLDQDYFGLPLRERVIAAVVVVVLGGFGLYVCTAKRPVPHVQRLRADR